MYNCEKCKQKFEFKSLLIRHKSKKNGCKLNIVDYDEIIIDINNKFNDTNNKINNLKNIISDTNNKINTITKNKLENKTQCVYCKKIYATKGSMDRHINTSCIEKKSLDTEKINFEENLNCLEKELKILQIKLNNTQIEQQRQHKIIEQEKERKRDEENKELKAMIEKLIERQPIQNITNNNNTINQTNNVIVINSFGNEDLSHITLQDYKKYFSTYFKGFINFIEKVHFDDNMPENHNICLTNLKSKDIKVYEGDKWIAKPKTDIIDKFLRKKLNTLIDKCEELEESDQIAEKVIDKFSEFQVNYMDDKSKKTTKDDVILMIYNNKDKVKIK